MNLLNNCMIYRGLFIGMLLFAVCFCFSAGCTGDVCGDDRPLSSLPNDSLVTDTNANLNVVRDTAYPGDDIQGGYYQKYARREPGAGTCITFDSVDELHTVLQNTTYGLISAGSNPSRPGEKNQPLAFFMGQHELLRKELIGMGYCFTGVLGNYDGFEDSFLVMTNDSGRDDMIKLGYMFSQESVIYGDHGKQEMIYTCDAVDTYTGEFILNGTVVTGEGYVAVGPEETNYYTEVTLSDGSQFRFSLNFDWDNQVPPSSHFPMSGYMVRIAST